MRRSPLYVSFVLVFALLAQSGCVDLTEPWAADSGVTDDHDPARTSDGKKTILLAYYTCDDDPGPFLMDHSTHDRNAKVEGTFSRAPSRRGSAADFAGAGYATVPAGILSGTAAFTIATWVKLHSNPSEQHVFDFSADANHFVSLTTNSSKDARGLGYTALRVTTGDTSLELPGPADSLETWTHWAVTGDGTTWTLYMGGFPITPEGAGPFPAVKDVGITGANHIGRSRAGDVPALDGAIDDFRIYNRALTVDEIRGLAGIAED